MTRNYGGRASDGIEQMQKQMETAALLDKAMNGKQVPGGFVDKGIALDLTDLLTPKVENGPPKIRGRQPLGANPIQVGDLPEAPPFRPMKSVLKK
jgi:hypothetical protein